jgi:hypothetical protein
MEPYLIAFAAYRFHHILIFGNRRVAAVTRFPLARTGPDSGDGVVRQAAVLYLGSNG